MPCLLDNNKLKTKQNTPHHCPRLPPKKTKPWAPRYSSLALISPIMHVGISLPWVIIGLPGVIPLSQLVLSPRRSILGTHRSILRESLLVNLGTALPLSLSLNPCSPKLPSAFGNKDQESPSQDFPEAQNDTCRNQRRHRDKTRKEREINVPVTSFPGLSRDYPFPRLLICLYHLKVLISTHKRSFISSTGTEWGCPWLMPKAQDLYRARFTCHLVFFLCLHPFPHLSHPKFPI